MGHVPQCRVLSDANPSGAPAAVNFFGHSGPEKRICKQARDAKLSMDIFEKSVTLCM